MSDQEWRAGSQAASEWAEVSLAAKAALSLSSTFIAIGLFTIGAALPTLQASFSGSGNASLLIQLISSIAAPAFALASPVAGVLAARYGVRSVYLASTVMFVLVGIAPAASDSLVAILALRILMGAAVAGAFTAGMVGISRLPESQRHGMFGLSAFLGGGIAIFAYQAVGILAGESWRLAFLVCLVVAPAGVFGLFLPRDGREAKESTPWTTAAGASSGRAGVPPWLVAVAVVVGWTMVAGSIYSPFYLASLGITDPAKVGFLLAILALCSLAGSGSYGFLQKRLGTSGVMQGGLVACALGCGMLSFGGGQPFPMIGLGLIGAGLGAAGTAIYALAIETIGIAGNSSAAMGGISLAIYLPQVVFPLAAQALAASFGPPWVYAAISTLLLIAAGLLMSRAHQAVAG